MKSMNDCEALIGGLQVFVASVRTRSSKKLIKMINIYKKIIIIKYINKLKINLLNNNNYNNNNSINYNNNKEINELKSQPKIYN